MLRCSISTADYNSQYFSGCKGKAFSPLLLTPPAPLHPRRPRQPSGDFRKRWLPGDATVFCFSDFPCLSWLVPDTPLTRSWHVGVPRFSPSDSHLSRVCMCCRVRHHLKPVETPGADVTCPGHTPPCPASCPHFRASRTHTLLFPWKSQREFSLKQEKGRVVTCWVPGPYAQRVVTVVPDMLLPRASIPITTKRPNSGW